MIETQNDSSHLATQTYTIISSSRSREPGEDYILVDRRMSLVGVFDAVGGRGNGRLASLTGAQTVHATWKDADSTEKKNLPLLLQGMIKQADERIALLSIPPAQKRPGTTVALAVLVDNGDHTCLTYAHVGDSRIYLLRDGTLRRLTQDNGYFTFAVQKGWLTQEDSLRIEQASEESSFSDEDLKHFQQRNKITCAVGWSDFSTSPTGVLDLLAGDRVLLCTDGIHDNLTDEEIATLLKKESGTTSARRLVRGAYQRSQQQQRRSKPDDMSAIVILVGWKEQSRVMRQGF